MLDKRKIENKIHQCIKSSNNNLENFDDSLLLCEDIGLGSFDLIMIFSEVEEEFGISIAIEKVNSVRTLGDLVDYILNNSVYA